MRKILTITALVLMATAMTFCLTACNDDDEDGSDGGSMPSPTLTDSHGTTLQIRSLTGGVSYTFGYDEKGKLTSINSYDFTGSTFKHTDEYGTFAITVNGKGLVTKIYEKEIYDDKYGKEEGEITFNLNYSGNQLTGGTISGSGSYESYNRDESETWTGTGSAKIVWNNGNLTRCVLESKTTFKENGKKYNESYHGTYTISYGNKENTFRQMPYYLSKEILDAEELGGVLGALGLLGVGPKELPSGYVLVDYDEDGDEDTETRTYAFTQNSNGSIKTESKNSSGSIITYNYNTIGTRAALEEQFESIVPNMRGFGKKFFKRNRH